MSFDVFYRNICSYDLHAGWWLGYYTLHSTANILFLTKIPGDDFKTSYVSQRRKKHRARPEIEPRTSRIPCEHSDHSFTEPQCRPVTISPCLIGLVRESAQNHAGTDETVPLYSQLEHAPSLSQQVSQGRKAHGPTGTQIQDLSHTVRALWPLNYRATRSTCAYSLASDPGKYCIVEIIL